MTNAENASKIAEEDRSRERHRGVLLVNVGTPDSADVAAVRRYLGEFLADPRVIQLPGMMRRIQRPLARFIAWRRAPHSARKYARIWTEQGSPLRVIMAEQAAALAKALPAGWEVLLGMRYGSPSIAEALREMARRDVEELVVVPLYPQFSGTTTGTTVDEVYRVLKAEALHLNVGARTTWHDDAGYLNAQAHLIADHVRQHDLSPEDTYLLFSAHGLPVSYIQRGDPYERQVTQSVRLLVERLGWPAGRQGIAYQSRLGPTEWLRPELTQMLRALADQGERRVVVCPISFATDCLETIEEVGIEATQLFESLGGKLHVCPALNANERFIDALKQLVLRGPRHVVTWSRGQAPLLNPARPKAPADARLDRLVMIGMSLPNRVGAGRGPNLAYSSSDELACVKRPHHEVEKFLRELKETAGLAEAFVWNTCFRFECYAWLGERAKNGARECAVATLRDQFVGRDLPRERVNTLFGRNAWHHLMRTIAGLNSGLPGDKDIVEQFQTAFQTAERAGTAGPQAAALVNEAVAMAASVRRETAWGNLDPGYCYAAMSQVQAQLPRPLANLRHVVVGGSTTSRSVLESLYTAFHVKPAGVTLIYRSHQGGQMKLLRKAVGHGRRLRVHDYTEPAAYAAIAEADVVFFGIDRAEPVLDRATLTGLRDLAQRPLYVVDFNTAGSTRDIGDVEGVRQWTAAELDAEVGRFAAAMCARREFPEIVQEAEQWIEQHAPDQVAPGPELPCDTRDEHGNPICGRCGRNPAAQMARSTT